MNSHDEGLLYAHMSHEDRQRYTQRKIRVSDIADAMNHGFKAEPDLSPCHLPLLSDEALARIHSESEKWRDKHRERELEQELDQMRAAEANVSRYYVTLREIIGAMHVPPSFRSVLSQPQHVAWTEQKARELVKKAEDCAVYARTAQSAEKRVDLLERYVTACDAKRVPYNWNVFKMPTADLHQLVLQVESMEKLTRCDCNPERVAWFETRTQQETEQSLRWHSQRADETRKLIEQYRGGRITIGTAEALLDALLDRPQCGEAQPDADGWIVWQRFDKDRRPPLLNDEDMVEIETVGGGSNVLEAGVIAWEQVKRFRRAK